jgi:hypothetical protein
MERENCFELLGQLCLLIPIRTKRASKGIKGTNLYLEANVLKEGNEKTVEIYFRKAI